MIAPLPARLAGTDLPPVDFEFSPRRLMSYAAALGATEDVYLNDLRPGGIVGLPTFVISPEWKVMNGEPYRAVLGADNERMWRCIHVQQDSRIFQTIRAHQRVTTRGKICVLRQTRIGAYIAVRLDTALADTGEPVAESWFCGIFLGDTVDGSSRPVAEPPTLASDHDPSEFTALPAPMLTVTRALPHLYTEAADIWNPIHTERSAARQAGLDDTLLHGSCTWGAAGLQIIRLLADGDPTRLIRIGARMTGKALVGADLFFHYKLLPTIVPGIASLAFQVVDGSCSPILSNGIAEIRTQD